MRADDRDYVKFDSCALPDDLIFAKNVSQIDFGIATVWVTGPSYDSTNTGYQWDRLENLFSLYTILPMQIFARSIPLWGQVITCSNLGSLMDAAQTSLFASTREWI